MRSSPSRVLAAILGLLGLLASWLVPTSASAGTSSGADLPACCSRPSAKRCCAGDCCIAPNPAAGTPSASLPSLPRTPLRVAPDWVPAFVHLLWNDAAPPFKTPAARPSPVTSRAPRLPLFLRDAALLL